MSIITKKKAADAFNTSSPRHITNAPYFRTVNENMEDLYLIEVNKQIHQLSLSAYIVIPGICGDFLVCPHHKSRYFSSFTQLQAFAKTLGVKHE